MFRYMFFIFAVLSLCQIRPCAAQLDLEKMLPEETAEDTVLPESASKVVIPNIQNDTAQNTEETTDFLAADKPEFAPAPPEPNDKAEIIDTPDQNDFMVEYFNEVDAAQAKDEQAQKAQNDAYKLIKEEPTMVTIEAEQQKLLNLAQKRRNQRLRAIQKAKEELEKELSVTPERAVTDNSSKFENALQKTPSIQPKKTQEHLQKAPFGLFWGETMEQAQARGFTFLPAKLENAVNVFAVNNSAESNKPFNNIVVVFGEQNHLNAIYAEGLYMKDSPQADKVLNIYERYFAALQQKYGNAKEYFEAADKDSPRGNDIFLQQLQQQKASLFAVFGNENIRITLAIDVNEKAQSRITLDYENLSIQQQDKEAALNSLMEEL